MDFTQEYWGHFNVSVGFLRGSVNSPGHYRAVATSQQLSDKERSRPHGEDVLLNRIYDVLNISPDLDCEWYRTNEFRGFHMPSVCSLVWTIEGKLTWLPFVFCLVGYVEVLDFVLFLWYLSHHTMTFFGLTFFSGILEWRKQIACLIKLTRLDVNGP